MTDNFYPVAVEARILAAIAPQLSELLDLERKHKRAARIERLRRQHDMWDAHDSAVEAYATGQAFGTLTRDLMEKVKDTAQVIISAWSPIIQALHAGMADQPPEPVPPVPADEHAEHWRSP